MLHLFVVVCWSLFVVCRSIVIDRCLVCVCVRYYLLFAGVCCVLLFVVVCDVFVVCRSLFVVVCYCFFSLLHVVSSLLLFIVC